MSAGHPWLLMQKFCSLLFGLHPLLQAVIGSPVMPLQYHLPSGDAEVCLLLNTLHVKWYFSEAFPDLPSKMLLPISLLLLDRTG